MSCVNRSTCRCIFNIFVGEGELHILLLHHLDPAPPFILLHVNIQCSQHHFLNKLSFSHWKESWHTGDYLARYEWVYF